MDPVRYARAAAFFYLDPQIFYLDPHFVEISIKTAQERSRIGNGYPV